MQATDRGGEARCGTERVREKEWERVVAGCRIRYLGKGILGFDKEMESISYEGLWAGLVPDRASPSSMSCPCRHCMLEFWHTLHYAVYPTCILLFF